MAAAAAEQVRNVVFVGQDGSGKTSLAEAMLFITGRTARMGTTVDGKSYLDYDEEEIKRQFTISSSIAPVEYKKTKINVLDTSGHPDFYGDTKATMQAAETALFVIDAASGPQVMTGRFWKEAGAMGLSRAVFINHVDRENTEWDTALSAVTDRFGGRLGLVAFPMGTASDFKGIVDVISMKARVMDGDKEKIEDIPAEYADEAEEAREQLIDLIAEADDELMMKYLEGEPFTQEEIDSLLKAAIAQDIFVPVFAGAATQKQGVFNLMDVIVSSFPAPEEKQIFQNADGEGIEISAAGNPAAYAFKTASDPFVGRLTFLKVLGGTLEPGQELINSRTRKKERLGHIYVMMGKENTDVKTAVAGDIVVVPKLSETRTGDTISMGGATVVEPLPTPIPMYPVAIEAVDKKDEDKLGTFIARQAEADATLQLARNEETHQTVLTAMGEAQVETLLSRLKSQMNIDVNLVPVRVPYRETIRKVAEAQGRHKKQTGGSGQFGDCFLRLEPNPGGGYEFLDEVVGGRIPRNFIPAVDKGVQDAMNEGFLAGYPMVDVKCAVYDGSYHPVDSNEMAFKTAARIGFRACCEKAGAVLLEPMANVEVTVPDEYAGAVMGDASTRRGRVNGTDSGDAGETIVKIRVPYAEVLTYTKDLRSITRGNGSYTLELEGYEEAPADVKKKMVEAYQASRNEGK